MEDKDKLLEEAKIRYPIGTRFVCRNSDCIGTISIGVFKVGINDCEELYVNEVDRLGNCVMTGTDYHCIYSNWEWSETIESECVGVEQYTKEQVLEFCEWCNFGNHPFSVDNWCVSENYKKWHDDNGVFKTTTELFDLWVKSKEDKDEKS